MGRTHSSRRLQDTSSAPGVSSLSCLSASRPRTSISYRTIPTTRCRGARWVLRLQQETWLDISPRFYLSADASYGTAFQEYCALPRLGFRATHRFALGLEGGALGNEEYDAGRAGGFLRLNFRAANSRSQAGSPATISRMTRAVALGILSVVLRLWERSGFARLHCRPRSGSAWPRLCLR
jgi:hypothetical protein